MLLELSYVLSETIPVYPGSPEEAYRKHTRIADGDPSNTTVITHYLHNGSHVDAPFHFDKDGNGIDQVAIENYCFCAPLVIECPKERSGLIGLDDLNRNGAHLFESDILLFHTGYSAVRAEAARYADDFPALSYEAARFIREELPYVKAIAIDTLSIESAEQGPELDFPVHKMLLHHATSDKRPLVIYEDVNVAPILGRPVKAIWAFPLRLQGLDGSPITMVAEV